MKIVEDESVFLKLVDADLENVLQDLHNIHQLGDGEDYCPEDVPHEKYEEVVRCLLKHVSKLYYRTVIERLCGMLDNKWYKGNDSLRHDVIEVLFEKFAADQVWSEEFEIRKSHQLIQDRNFYYIKSFSEEVRWRIGFTISNLIKPTSKTDQSRYLTKLRKLIFDNKYGYGRLSLIDAYSKIGKDDVISELIGFLDDRDLLQNAIVALGRLKAIDAKARLIELAENPDSKVYVMSNDYVFFKDLIKKALKKIG